MVSEAAETLFGCYTRAEANNPVVYTAAVQAILSEYEPKVIAFVTDPRTGLPSRLKWLPSIAEVRVACDEAKKYYATLQDLFDKGYTLQDGRLLKPNGRPAF